MNILDFGIFVCRARLVTGKKTVEHILAQAENHYLSGRALAASLAYYRALDGAICYLVQNLDDYEAGIFRLMSFEEEYDAQVKEAFWLYHQDSAEHHYHDENGNPTYCQKNIYFNNRKEFDKAWEEGFFEYGLGVYVYHADELEILEVKGLGDEATRRIQ